MKYFQLALSFLTIIPTYIDEEVKIDDLGRAAGWFPFVGAMIGTVVVLVRWGAELFVSPLIAAILAVVFWSMLTGGLHLDGLADCCDGMLAAATPERRLEIMKDPRLGTFGGAGLILHLMLKVVLLSTLSGLSIVWGVALATSLGRWIVLLAARQPQARPDGLGAGFASGLRWPMIFVAGVLPITFAALAGIRGLVSIVMVCLVGWIVFWVVRRRLNGMTGDVFGMLIELSEVIVLLVFAVQWPLAI